MDKQKSGVCYRHPVLHLPQTQSPKKGDLLNLSFHP